MCTRSVQRPPSWIKVVLLLRGVEDGKEKEEGVGERGGEKKRREGKGRGQKGRHGFRGIDAPGVYTIRN